MIETTLEIIFWDTIGGIIKNLPLYIMLIWGVKSLSKSISQEVPNWISQINKETKEKNAIRNALNKFGR